MKRIAFVSPWYGEKAKGGAEAELRELAHHLYEIGVDLEILTTCVRDFTSDWNINYYPEGIERCKGIPVRRFPVRTRDEEAFDRINAKLLRRKNLTKAEEEVFQREMINSPKLYQYISEHQDQYALFVFIPYMFGTTYSGIQICPEKTAVIPCLHDEGYAYMRLWREVFPPVRGMVFNAAPEKELAERLYNLAHVKTVVMGIGMETDVSGDAAYFRMKYGITEPFILYAGRKDAGKGVGELIQYYAKWKSRSGKAVKLVLIGGGNIDIPEGLKDDVLDLGFVSAEDKYGACSAALFLCQPSQYESFSLVIMESWLCARPVLVHGNCAVTKNFVQESGGGLYFANCKEFAKCVDYFLKHPEESGIMGNNGRRYVHAHFSWPVILNRYIAYFEELTGEKFQDLKMDDSGPANSAAALPVGEVENLSGIVSYFADGESERDIANTIRAFSRFRGRAPGCTLRIYNSLPFQPEVHGIAVCGFINDRDFGKLCGSIALIPHRTPGCLNQILSAGIPLLVSKDIDELHQLCRQANCGLYFSNQAEFLEELAYLLRNPASAQMMGRNAVDAAQTVAYKVDKRLSEEETLAFLCRPAGKSRLAADALLIYQYFKNHFHKNTQLYFLPSNKDEGIPAIEADSIREQCAELGIEGVHIGAEGGSLGRIVLLGRDGCLGSSLPENMEISLAVSEVPAPGQPVVAVEPNQVQEAARMIYDALACAQ